MNTYFTNGKNKNQFKIMLRETYTLIKLPEASPGHGWVVSPVHFGNVIALYICNLIHCKISCKWHLVALRNKQQLIYKNLDLQLKVIVTCFSINYVNQ